MTASDETVIARFIHKFIIFRLLHIRRCPPRGDMGSHALRCFPLLERRSRNNKKFLTTKNFTGFTFACALDASESRVSSHAPSHRIFKFHKNKFSKKIHLPFYLYFFFSSLTARLCTLEIEKRFSFVLLCDKSMKPFYRDKKPSQPLPFLLIISALHNRNYKLINNFAYFSDIFLPFGQEDFFRKNK